MSTKRYSNPVVGMKPQVAQGYEKSISQGVAAQVMDRGIDPNQTPRLAGDGMEYVSDERSAPSKLESRIPKLSKEISLVSLLPDVRQSLHDEQLVKIITLENDVKKLKAERSSLEYKLQEQVKINKEIKRLLVASVGADLFQQLEDLTRDKIRLAEDLENTIQTLTEERETIQQLDIQCDVWRSKFLGSRVQVDDLVGWKGRATLMYEEARLATEKLLNERDEMRSHMMESNKKLQYLSDALQRSHTLSQEPAHTSTNVMTLSLVNHQLAATISEHLLGDVGSGSKKKSVSAVSAQCHSLVEWTPAEMLAKDIIVNKKLDKACTDTIDDGEASTSSSGTSKPHKVKINRFHPMTKYENLTVNCCKDCTGEIQIV
ncbi:golgin-45-like [Ptychodera flava]|uniref:golgin-45-like n=1 Tax=Ptychodera flava TaxID=63121 RepID=UPI003969C6AE